MKCEALIVEVLPRASDPHPERLFASAGADMVCVMTGSFSAGWFGVAGAGHAVSPCFLGSRLSRPDAKTKSFR